MFVAKRILILTREVKFAIDAKRALEREGQYEVTSFSSGKAAVDYVRQNAQDIVIVDFRVQDMPGADVIDHVRAMQPDIAVIAAPDHEAIHKLKERYHIQAIINIPYPIRKLVAIVDTSIKEMFDSQPDTQTSPAVPEQDSRRNRTNTIEFWVSETLDGEAIVEVPVIPEPVMEDAVTHTFAKLAAEEPPMPKFEDGSTIRDLRDSLNVENVHRIISALESASASPEPEPEVKPEDSKSIPAAIILETALDESTPIRTFSVAEFISRVQERGQTGILPLPSWLDESERYIREPKFLPETLPQLGQSEYDYTATITEQNKGRQPEQDPSVMVTDQIEPVRRSHPVEAKPAETVEPPLRDSEIVANVTDLKQSPRVNQPVSAEKPPMLPPTLPEVTPEVAQTFAYTDYEDATPQVAQLALTLTQVSMELTAEACILTREKRIVAYAGNLPREDVDELREQMADDWEATENKSRIRFVTLPSSGMDYMLFTRSTEGGFTLSMIFSGTRPLHDIRRQGKRLADALAVVPDVVIEEPTVDEPVSPVTPAIFIPASESVGELAPFTYVWMLRDSNASIPDDLARAIVMGLDIELSQAGWQIHALDVHDDFVYLYADMPIQALPQQVIKDLVRASSLIAQGHYPDLQTDQLWNDSYLILQPGREMSMDEIQRFISFARR